MCAYHPSPMQNNPAKFVIDRLEMLEFLTPSEACSELNSILTNTRLVLHKISFPVLTMVHELIARGPGDTAPRHDGQSNL